MKRAIVVYLDYTRGLLQQFACLYTSFKYVDCSDNTDLVVFGPKASLDLVPNDCIKVELNPLEGIWKSYRFINSLHCISSDKSEFLAEYDYLLRTDVDTFLTPAWNPYLPNFYTVGIGAYCNTENVLKNIKRVSEKFGLRHQGLHNIGSTHYGGAIKVMEVCKLSEQIAYYLLTEEFAQDGGDWPDWFCGVTSMYSTEIAVNHLVDRLNIEPDILDFPSTSTNSFYHHPHIHCWHTDNLFSKFQYGDGKYDSMLDDIHSIEVRQYCLRMALKAKRSLPGLYI
ncbi:hypothetical protein [Heyndrickxia acidicola]|uniref:DUF7164 domain-containing protein n=1 Tax=Heyndrickxia acidicola TaxID=209389 RepID=A0ABU6MQE0_9BACI|nr:hypothetical protein [Heyndrickxia acidicola]MED1205442.1 hypothetical protein [Heyndrickxia acidicola]